MELDHTIVYVKDKDVSARFYSRVLGFEYRGTGGTQSFVRVNDTLVIRLEEREPRKAHYAFHVSEEEFDAVLSRRAGAGGTHGPRPGAAERGGGEREGS